MLKNCIVIYLVNASIASSLRALTASSMQSDSGLQLALIRIDAVATVACSICNIAGGWCKAEAKMTRTCHNAIGCSSFKSIETGNKMIGFNPTLGSGL